MRIAYFADAFPSGSETWIHHEIAELRKLGHEVRVFSTRRRPANVAKELADEFESITIRTEDGARLGGARAWRSCINREVIEEVLSGLFSDTYRIRLKAQLIRDAMVFAKWFDSVREFNPDYTYAHFAGSRATLAHFYRLRGGCPFVFKLHAEDVFSRPALLRRKVACARGALTISKYNVDFIRREYQDVDSGKIKIHRCGLPLQEYMYAPRKRSDGEPIVLSVGRLVRMKGFDDLIRASCQLQRRGHRHQLRIVGEGPMRPNLEQLIESHGARNFVTLHGYAGPNAVKALLGQASLFALACVWDEVAHTQDGIPVAIMEAMATGVPVVTTRTSGIPELVRDGFSGVLVSPNAAGELADGIERLLVMNESSRREMLDNARRTIEDEYDVVKLTRELVREHFSG